jgi:hypothetical protein
MSNLCLAGRVFDLLPLHWNAVALIRARNHHCSEYGCSLVGARARSPLTDNSVKFCQRDEQP